MLATEEGHCQVYAGTDEPVRPLYAPDDAVMPSDQADLQAMIDSNMYHEKHYYEQLDRTMLGGCNIPQVAPACDRHQDSDELIGEHPILKSTALLPVCEDCCAKKTGIRANDAHHAIDTCSCGSRGVAAFCWHCQQEAMVLLTKTAITNNTRTLRQPSGVGKKVLVCACGKDVLYELGGKPEWVRQCACCSGIVTFPFLNAFGNTLVFGKCIPKIKRLYPTPFTLPPHMGEVSASTRAMLEADTHDAVSAPPQGGRMKREAPKKSTVPSPPSDLQPPLPGTQGMPTSPLPTPSSSSPSLPKLAFKTRTLDSSGLKRKAFSKDDLFTVPIDGIEDGTKKKRTKLTPTPQHKSQTVSRKEKAVLAGKQKDVKAFTPLMPFAPIAESVNNPPSAHDNFNATSIAAPTAPAQPSCPARPTNIVDLINNKALLRKQYQEHPPMIPVPFTAPLDRIMKVEKEKRNGKPYTKNGYDQLLLSCMFDLQARQKIGTFVEQVWNGKVAINEVGIVAGIALTYGA